MTPRGLFRMVTADIVIISTILIESACAAPGGRLYVVVAPPPPPVVVEARLVAPGQGYSWVAGHHRWDGRAYLWMPGTWVRSPRPRAVWVPAQWVRERRGWYFVEGHWR